jgi:glucose uptake protein GlcU
MQIPKIAWTIIAVVLIIMGTFNILAVTQDPQAFEGVDNPPNLTKGIIFLISGLAYFVLLIVRKYKNKKARIEGEDIS